MFSRGSLKGGTVEMLHTKKVAAAIAAVLQHVAEVETPSAKPVGTTAAPTLPTPGVWGLAGRQDAMLFRSFWQQRLPRF